MISDQHYDSMPKGEAFDNPLEIPIYMMLRQQLLRRTNSSNYACHYNACRFQLRKVYYYGAAGTSFSYEFYGPHSHIDAPPANEIDTLRLVFQIETLEYKKRRNGHLAEEEKNELADLKQKFKKRDCKSRKQIVVAAIELIE